MRRVDCRRWNAVIVEEVPWGDGKRTRTKAYILFLARWARRLSWKETADDFRTSWEKVFDAVESASPVCFGSAGIEPCATSSRPTSPGQIIPNSALHFPPYLHINTKIY